MNISEARSARGGAGLLSAFLILRAGRTVRTAAGAAGAIAPAAALALLFAHGVQHDRKYDEGARPDCDEDGNDRPPRRQEHA